MHCEYNVFTLEVGVRQPVFEKKVTNRKAGDLLLYQSFTRI